LSEDPKHIERCRGVVKFLDATVRNIAVYPPEHPSVTGVSRRVFEHLAELLGGREEIQLGIVNGILYVDDYLFNEPTPYSGNFLKTISAFEIEDLLITCGVTQEEVLKLAGILMSTDHGKESFLRQAEQAGLKHIGLKGFLVPVVEDPVAGVVTTYWDAVNALTGFFGGVVEGRLPPLLDVLKLVERLRESMVADRETLLLLTSLKGYERYTEQHSVNVCLLAMLLAQRERLDEQEIGMAALAGLMHDAGMVKVPGEVTGKSGTLTPSEREAFKSHPVHSAGIVHGMEGPEEVTLAVERHHVHFVGGGYPAGINREEVPLLAAILSVVDSYDAMTTTRPYNKPVDTVQALAFLEKGRGTRFDPKHVDAFVSMLGPFPPGSVVRLSSNEIGIVTRLGDDPGKPAVRMFIDEDGRTVEEPWDLYLGEDEVQGRVIAGIVDQALYGLSSDMAFGT
jgi:HD-GYP domain-containing protein (c-di-GMP phosphodiesterase class II)